MTGEPTRYREVVLTSWDRGLCLPHPKRSDVETPRPNWILVQFDPATNVSLLFSSTERAIASVATAVTRGESGAVPEIVCWRERLLLGFGVLSRE